MSETVTVRRREFGFSLMDDCGSTAYVPDDDAPAVALALLGDRDALVERAARAMEASWTKETGLPVSDKVRRYCRLDAEIVLAAIGGGGEGRA